jgi:hypothetical protein
VRQAPGRARLPRPRQVVHRRANHSRARPLTLRSRCRGPASPLTALPLDIDSSQYECNTPNRWSSMYPINLNESVTPSDINVTGQ